MQERKPQPQPQPQPQPLAIEHHALPLVLRLPRSELVTHLPYADASDSLSALAPTVKRLIAEELKQMSPRNYLEELPSPSEAYFSRPEIQRELARIEAGEAADRFSNAPYETVQPPARRDDIQSWEAAVAQAQRSLPNSETRVVNLELIRRYGKAQWADRTAQLEALLGSAKLERERLATRLEGLNKRRKFSQIQEVGPALTRLEQDVRAQVNKNCRLEGVCAQLESELRKKKRCE